MKSIIVVDGYSAANQFATEIRRRGFSPLHLQSSQIVPAIFTRSFCPNDFDFRFVYDGNFKALVKTLSEFDVAAVIAGTENGVELGDRLSEALGLLTNGTGLSRARRDKYEMAERIKACGLRSIRHLRASSPDEILRWAHAEGIEPVVLKPLNSAGTDSVAFCHSPAEVYQAFQNIYGQPNKLGFANTAVLAQEFIEGTEYIVNSVSRDGQVYIHCMLQYQKTSIDGTSRIYDRDFLVPRRGAIQDELVAYHLKVLDALGIMHGPAHAEIYWTPTGPVLVEIGARIDGMGLKAWEEPALSKSHVGLALDAYLMPESFKKICGSDYSLQKHGTIVSGIAHDTGVVRALPGKERLASLDTYLMMQWRCSDGDWLQPTRDLFSSPYYVILMHEDPERLRSDYARIRLWEREGQMFTVEATDPEVPAAWVSRLASEPAHPSAEKR